MANLKAYLLRCFLFTSRCHGNDKKKALFVVNFALKTFAKGPKMNLSNLRNAWKFF